MSKDKKRWNESIETGISKAFEDRMEATRKRKEDELAKKHCYECLFWKEAKCSVTKEGGLATTSVQCYNIMSPNVGKWMGKEDETCKEFVKRGRLDE